MTPGLPITLETMRCGGDLCLRLFATPPGTVLPIAGELPANCRSLAWPEGCCGGKLSINTPRREAANATARKIELHLLCCRSIRLTFDLQN